MFSKYDIWAVKQLSQFDASPHKLGIVQGSLQSGQHHVLVVVPQLLDVAQHQLHSEQQDWVIRRTVFQLKTFKAFREKIYTFLQISTFLHVHVTKFEEITSYLDKIYQKILPTLRRNVGSVR